MVEVHDDDPGAVDQELARLAVAVHRTEPRGWEARLRPRQSLRQQPGGLAGPGSTSDPQRPLGESAKLPIPVPPSRGDRPGCVQRGEGAGREPDGSLRVGPGTGRPGPQDRVERPPVHDLLHHDREVGVVADRGANRS